MRAKTRVVKAESADVRAGEIQTCLESIFKTLNKHKLSARELVILLGNLSYTVGASLGGFKGKGPSLEELEKKYYSNPDLPTALMLQGLTVTSWTEDIGQNLTPQAQ